MSAPPTREISRPALPAVLGGGKDVALSVVVMVESISNIKIGHWIVQSHLAAASHCYFKSLWFMLSKH